MRGTVQYYAQRLDKWFERHNRVVYFILGCFVVFISYGVYQLLFAPRVG